MKRDRVAEVHYYEWRMSAWATSETRDRLDATGRGIYRELLDHCYGQGKIPDDPEWICRRCACTFDEYEKTWKVIGRHFPKISRTAYRYNVHADIFRREYFAYVEKQRACRKNRLDKVNENSEIRYGGSTNGNGNGNGNVTATLRESVAPAAPPSRPKSPDYQVRVELLYQSHPVPGFKQDGILRYLEILSSAVNQESTAAAISANHDEWVAHWASHPAEFKPGFGKYFEDGYYLRKPAVVKNGTHAKPSVSQLALEKVRREEQNALNRSGN